MFSNIAIEKLIKDYSFDSVLDVGSGKGEHSDRFFSAGKKVTAVDLGTSKYFKSRNKAFKEIRFLEQDFFSTHFNEKFDCVWASHILEHQRNVGLFLEKIISLTKENGIICITVPPLKHQIVGGHLTLWNAGILLYNLVMSGIDCSNAKVLKYGYNISVIVTNVRAEIPKNLSYDIGDIEKLRNFFPENYNFQGFDGNITNLNW